MWTWLFMYTKKSYHILVYLLNLRLGGKHAVLLSGDHDVIALRRRRWDVDASACLRANCRHAFAVGP